MPSEEFVAVVTEYESARNRKERINALEAMWLLQEPEVIEVVSLIYREADDNKVRDKAAEVLGKYKGLYQAMEAPPKSGGARVALRNLLLLTLVLLLAANGALFFLANNKTENTERDLAAERVALLDQIEADMTTAREFAIDLRATARDIEEESTTLEAACSKSFTPLPQRIVLAEHQRGFFPDIENFLTDPIGDYLVALDGAQLALETWNTGCTNQVVDTDRVIDLARAVVESTDAALNIRIPDLRDNPFVTPTPSPRPTNTPTNTPEPSPTPLPRSREDIIRQMYTIVEHAQVNADIVFNSTRDALRNNNLRDYCQTERFWDDVVLITLTGDEVETASDIATYLEDTQNGFSTTISQSQAMLAEWERLCRSGKPSDVELDALNRLAQSVQEEIRKAQTSLLNTFGPKPE